MKIEIDRKIFNTAYLPSLDDYARVQIFYGGSGSGKSVFVAQRSVYDLLAGGRNYLVCRKVARTIRGSVFQEICKVIAAWGLANLFNINKSDMVITCTNGYQIIFVGLDDTEKIKSITPAIGVITDVWVEEATETERDDIKQLRKRQRGGDDSIKKRMILTFNPILKQHWIYQDYFSQIGWTDEQTEYRGEELSILKTWYIHNRFLTEDDRKDLTRETDGYYYQVYTLGNWGILGDVIFTNVVFTDLLDEQSDYFLPVEQRTNRKQGLDFGFSSDPAAMSVTHYDKQRKRIYFFDELYERGLTNDLLASELKAKIGSDRVKCDSAEPKSIKELRNYGVNAEGAVKGKDSIIYGIQWLQQQTLIIDKRCINTYNEFSTYHWKKDKDGNAVREPIDKNNHLIDGTRYAYEDEMNMNRVEVVDDPFADW